MSKDEKQKRRVKGVIAINNGITSCLAGCSSCSWTAGLDTDMPKPKDVRNAVYRHVRQTGHKCWIESASSTHYSPEY